MSRDIVKEDFKRRERGPQRQPRQSKKKDLLTHQQILQVRQAISATLEERYLTSQFNAQAISNAGTITPFTTIAQGDGQGQRDGDHIQLKKLRIHLNVTAADTTNVIRVVVFQWRVNTADATPTELDILDNGPNTGLDVLSQYNYAKRKQYKILFDREYYLTDGGVQVYGDKAEVTDLVKAVEYTAGATTGINTLYWLAVSDSAAVSHPILNLSFRLWYTDA